MKTSHPAARATLRATMLTPPVPWSRIVCPVTSFCPSVTSELQAVTPAHGKQAASTALRWSGMCTHNCSSTTRWLASTPSTSPPSHRRCCSSPVMLFWSKIGHTLSLTLNLWTCEPTEITSPAASEHGIPPEQTDYGFVPFKMLASRKLRLTASTWMRIELAGSGDGIASVCLSR